jgi:phage anti-repressor protein
MIDARRLHGWLEVEQRFNDWMRRRINEYRFEEPTDLLRYSDASGKGRGGHNRIGYLLTVDTAKELAMIERTEKGRTARRYFIAMEKAAIKMAADHVANGTPEAIPQEFFDAAAAAHRRNLRISAALAESAVWPAPSGEETPRPAPPLRLYPAEYANWC